MEVLSTVGVIYSKENTFHHLLTNGRMEPASMFPVKLTAVSFFADKGDNCEAHLFNMPDCFNSSRTYVNTVVFMPEERPVGGVWNSMLVRCGVDVPPPKILDPSILGDALKKPGGG